MNRSTVRIILVVGGVALFVAGALAAAGWVHGPDVAACALGGLACWLASTLP
jgi:hypothetical protein